MVRGETRTRSCGARAGLPSANGLIPLFLLVLGSLLPEAPAALSDETAVLAAGLSFSPYVRYTTSQDRGESWSTVRLFSVAASGASSARKVALCPGIQLPASNETDAPSSSDFVLALVSSGTLYRQPLVFRSSDSSLEPTSRGAGSLSAPFNVITAVCGRAARSGEIWVLGSGTLGRAFSPAATTVDTVEARDSCSEVVAASPSELSFVADRKLLLMLNFVGEGSNASTGVYLATISTEAAPTEGGEVEEIWYVTGCTLQTSTTGSGLAGFGGSYALPVGPQLYRGSLSTGGDGGATRRRRRRRLRASETEEPGTGHPVGDTSRGEVVGAAPGGRLRHFRRLLATNDVPAGLTGLLDSAWVSTVSYLLDATAASDATGVFFRSAVHSSENTRRRLLWQSSARRRLQLQPSRDNQVWLTEPISVEGQTPRLLPGVGPALFNASAGTVGGTACWYKGIVTGEEPFVFGEGLVAAGTTVASAAVAGTSAGATAQAVVGQMQGQASSALSSSASASASAASASAATAAWILVGHTQRTSLIGRSVPAFSRDLAELGRSMGWVSFHWSFAGVPSGYQDPFPVQYRGTKLKPLYIQDPAETLPSVVLALTVFLACVAPVLALMRPCLLFAQHRGSTRAGRLLEAWDRPLRWAPAALASRALLLAMRPLVAATAQHVADPTSTGLGGKGGFLTLAWIVLLFVVLPCAVLLPLLFLYWQRVIDGVESVKEADQSSASGEKGAEAERPGPAEDRTSGAKSGGKRARGDSDGGDQDAGKAGETKPGPGGVSAGSDQDVGKADETELLPRGAEAGGDSAGEKQDAGSAAVQGEATAGQAARAPDEEQDEGSKGSGGGKGQPRFWQAEDLEPAPPKADLLAPTGPRVMLLGPLIADYDESCVGWAAVAFLRDWMEMMLTGLLVGADGAQLALLFLGQVAFVCALFVVRPFKRPLNQLGAQVVEMLILSYFFWGLLLLAAPRSPVLVMLAFLANISASLFMGAVVILGALPRAMSTWATLALLNSSLRVYLALEPLAQCASESRAGEFAGRVHARAAACTKAVATSAARAGRRVSRVAGTYVGEPLLAAGGWWVEKSAAAAEALSSWIDEKRASARGEARVVPTGEGSGNAGEADSGSRAARRTSADGEIESNRERRRRRRQERRERRERGEEDGVKRSGSSFHFMPFPM